MDGGLVQMFQERTLEVTTTLSTTSFGSEPARIEGGNLLLGSAAVFNVPDRENVAMEARIAGIFSAVR